MPIVVDDRGCQTSISFYSEIESVFGFRISLCKSGPIWLATCHISIYWRPNIDMLKYSDTVDSKTCFCCRTVLTCQVILKQSSQEISDVNELWLLSC